MPQIESVPVPLYQPLDPYHHIADNTPIIGLINRIFLVNNQVDGNTIVLNSAIGTQGTLSNRLAQSINPDGTLKTIAIDNALHSIAQHLDGGGFVRMTLNERAKLSFISPHATSLSVNVDTISGTVPFINSVMEISPSDSITWRYMGGKVYADTNFPASVRHVHYYGLTPITSDNINYKTTTVNTAYMQGSLRVRINGVSLNENSVTYVPIGLPGTITWTPFSYTEGAATAGVVTGGNFQMSAVVPSSAQVIIDFDFLFT